MHNIKYQIDQPLIFIGTGRSGTTLISEIIMRNPDLAYPSQYNNKYYRYPQVNILRYLFDNKFYRIFGAKMTAWQKRRLITRFTFNPSESYQMWNYITGKDIDFRRSFLLHENITRDQKNFIRNYFIKLMKYQGKKRFTFKITGPSRIRFLQQIFPDAYFVYLKRNPVPVISSFYKVKFWETRGKNKIHWHGSYTDEELNEIEKHKDNPVYMTAIQIKKLIDMHQYEVETCKPNIIEISYEDFIKKPQSIIDKLLTFAKLENNAETCFKYLDKLTIYNRNKTDAEYFNKNEIEIIKKIF